MSRGFAHLSRSLALVAALALPSGFSLGCSHAGQVTGWQVNRTRNVVLYTDARLEHEFIQEWLELSHAAFQAFFPEVTTGPVEAVWLKNEPGALTRIYSPLDDPRAGWTFETMPSGGIGRDGLIVPRAAATGSNTPPTRWCTSCCTDSPGTSSASPSS
jgi:hypothetical protein